MEREQNETIIPFKLKYWFCSLYYQTSLALNSTVHHEISTHARCAEDQFKCLNVALSPLCMIWFEAVRQVLTPLGVRISFHPNATLRQLLASKVKGLYPHIRDVKSGVPGLMHWLLFHWEMDDSQSTEKLWSPETVKTQQWQSMHGPAITWRIAIQSVRAATPPPCYMHRLTLQSAHLGH